MTDAKTSHGGRRHGLARSGEAPRLVVRVSPDVLERLRADASAAGVTLAEWVRRILSRTG